MIDLQGIAKSPPTFFGIADLQRPADQPNAAAASARKMTHRLVCALVIVSDHRVFCELRVGSHDQNEGGIHLFDHLPQSWAEIASCLGEQNPVHPFGE